MVKDKETKKIDTKDSKNRRVMTAIANLGLGEVITPTALFNSIGIHPDTGRDLLDLYESLTEVGFEILRENSGKIKGVLRTDESLNVRKDIREIKNKLNDVEGVMDKLVSVMEMKK